MKDFQFWIFDFELTKQGGMAIGAAEAEVEEQPDTFAAPAWAWLTVEHALYGLILLAAGFVRFFGLTAHPLNAVEAANIWPAWLAATGREAPELPVVTSPLLHSVNTLLFWLMGGGDAMARAAPAAAGAALVLLCWWLRPWIGRTAALVAALLMAFDPWLTWFSRMADGAMLGLFFGMLTLVGLWRLLHLPVSAATFTTWRRVTAVALGLLMVSGPMGWNFVVVVVLFLFQFDPGLTTFREKALGRRGDLLWLGAAAALGATTWLAHPAGLGMISSSLSAWVAQLGGDGPAYPLSWWALRLWVDAPFLLMFGGLGLGWRWQQMTSASEDDATFPRQRRAWLLFLTAWLLWGMLLSVLPGRSPYALPMIGLPLLLAGADLCAAIIRGLRTGVNWRESWLLLGLVTVLLTSSVFWGAALIAQSQLDLLIARGMLLFVLLAAVTVVLYALWADWRQARLLMGGYGAVLLFLVTLSSLWQLNHHAHISRPDGLFASFTDADIRRLAADIQLLSAQRTGDATQLTVLAQRSPQLGGRPDPVLGWYLRDMRNLRWVLAPDVESTASGQSPVVITVDPMVDDPALAGYMGSRYLVHGQWLPSQLLPAEPNLVDDGAITARLNRAWESWLRGLLRWVVHREVGALPPVDGVVLWVKSGE